MVDHGALYCKKCKVQHTSDTIVHKPGPDDLEGLTPLECPDCGDITGFHPSEAFLEKHKEKGEHGGARPGAGRKSCKELGKKKKQTISAVLSQEAYEHLTYMNFTLKQGDNKKISKSQLVERCIEFYFEHKLEWHDLYQEAEKEKNEMNRKSQ